MGRMVFRLKLDEIDSIILSDGFLVIGLVFLFWGVDALMFRVVTLQYTCCLFVAIEYGAVRFVWCVIYEQFSLFAC